MEVSRALFMALLVLQLLRGSIALYDVEENDANNVWGYCQHIADPHKDPTKPAMLTGQWHSELPENVPSTGNNVRVLLLNDELYQFPVTSPLTHHAFVFH